LPETRTCKPAKVEYGVHFIIGHKGIGQKQGLQYLFPWTGYSLQFDTWEPAVNLRNAPLVLSAYKSKWKL
jgi:hypothetical protein